MNKGRLISELARKQSRRNISKTAIKEIVQSIFDHMQLSIHRRKKFSYPGFGSFVIRKRKKRTARNPKTGETLTVPSRKTVLFRPFREIKNKLNKA